MALLEDGDGGEHLFGTPRSALSAPVHAIESCQVVAGILSVPGLGELTLTLPGGSGAPTVVP